MSPGSSRSRRCRPRRHHVERVRAAQPRRRERHRQQARTRAVAVARRDVRDRGVQVAGVAAQLLDHPRHRTARRPVPRDPVDQRRQPRHRVGAELRRRRMPGLAERGHAHGQARLLAEAERDDDAAVGERDAAALVEDVVDAQVGAGLDATPDPDLLAAVLLVGLGDQDEVPGAGGTPRAPGSPAPPRSTRCGSSCRTRRGPTRSRCSMGDGGRCQSRASAGTTSVWPVSASDGPPPSEPRDRSSRGPGRGRPARTRSRGDEVVAQQLGRRRVARVRGVDAQQVAQQRHGLDRRTRCRVALDLRRDAQLSAPPLRWLHGLEDLQVLERAGRAGSRGRTAGGTRAALHARAPSRAPTRRRAGRAGFAAGARPARRPGAVSARARSSRRRRRTARSLASARTSAAEGRRPPRTRSA